VYSKKEKPVTSRREKTNISPSSSPAVDYIHRDDAEDLGTGSDDNIVTNDYSYRGSGMDISPRPVTSASQITINKHNSPANRDISLPSRKVLFIIHVVAFSCIFWEVYCVVAINPRVQTSS